MNISKRQNSLERIIDTLRGKRLCIHFDGKQIKEIDEQDVAVNVERIAISVTSPDLEDDNDILLGVVQASSLKGSDQVEVIMDLFCSML